MKVAQQKYLWIHQETSISFAVELTARKNTYV